jgi:type I restriction enzyme S subunit
MKKGFPTKPLQSLCDDVKQDIVDGPFGSELKREDYITEGIPVLKIQNVKPFAIELKKMDYVSAEKFHELRRHSFRRGDIVMTKLGSPLGVSAIVEDVEEGVIVADLVRIRAQQINTKYLCYHLNSQRTNDFINSMQKGTTRPRVTLSVVRELPIYVPPLPEQQRIVALLDEAFAGLATAKANAEQNLQNARAIFEGHLQSVFSQRGEGWQEKRLEEVCGLQNGFAFKSSTFKPYGVPILRISNIQDGRIDAANRIVFFDPSDYRENLDRYRIVEGDLLIAMSGATTGKLGFNTESKVYYLNQRVGKFEPTEKLNKHFLYHFLSTKVEENLRISAGTAQPNLSTEQIKGFVLPLPSVDEQERIVDALETLSKETQRLIRLYERKLAALEELKKSLLHQAFNGEL